MKTTRDIINEVDDRLDTPDKWVQGKYATDKNGKSIVSGSKDAVRWCLSGAINACVVEGGEDAISKGRAYNLLSNMLPEPLENWNDDPTTNFQDVKSLLKLAKKKA